MEPDKVPVDEKKLIKEIKTAGCSIRKTTGGHFIVLDPSGKQIAAYAVRHPGKREVFDHYAKDVRKALAKVKQSWIEMQSEIRPGADLTTEKRYS